MKKIFTFAAAMLASLTMMAQSYTTLFSTDFSDASWAEHDTICKGTTAEETINGIFFRSADNSKFYTIADGALTFCNNNAGNKYFIAIPVQNVKDSVIVTIGTVDNGQRVSYLFRETNIISASSVSMSNTAASINTNKSITIKYKMETDSTVALVMLGRQGSGFGTVIKSITITTPGEPAPPSTDSVAEATVTGVDSCYIGTAVKLTCTAAHATTYQWYNNSGAIEGATAANYTFTPEAAGSYGFYCMASNEYNVNPVRSNTKIVVATEAPKACGNLITATTAGNVSGLVGGTINTNLETGSSKKLDKNKYFGVSLAYGAFAAGDTFAIHITAGADLGKFMIYGDNAGTDLVFDQGIVYTKADAASPVICPTGWMEVVLPAAANGKTALYLYRENGNTQWNVTFDSIAIFRSCEESSNANIARVYAQAGEEEQEFTQLEDTFYIEVPQDIPLTSAPIHFVLEHPLATINVANPLTMNIPAIGGAPVEQVVVVTAENGDTKNYTIRIIRRAEASHDAKLRSLSVTGYTLVPAFDPEVLEYTITKAYGSDNPGTNKLEYEKNDAAADVAKSVCATSDTLIITVTAEDKTTVLEYKIAILEAEAPKKIYEIYMNNHYGAYIPEGQPVDSQKIYAFYLAGEQVPTVDSIKVNEGTTYAVEGDTVILTGADQSVAKYALEIAAVTPATLVVDSLYTFDGNESWIKSGYGFDAAKGGWKFSKTDTDYSREIAGKTHVEFFMPACDTILIATGDQGNERDVKFYINGAAFGEKVKLTKAGIKLAVKQSAAFMLTLASAQTSGDGGVGSIKLIEAAEPVGPTLYTVTIAELTNGTIEFANLGNADHQYAEGDTVRLIITPADGYELVSANAGNEALIPDEDGNCAFEMPGQNVTVTATFKAVTPEPVLYSVTLGTYEHGTVAFIEPNEDHKYAEGEEVRLSVTPDEGYEVETVKLEAINQNIPVVDGVATFNMPAQDVVVLATFKPVGEGFEYIDASTKAVKFFENGKLLIKRGDKVFDAKGQIVE